jgi:DNA-binding protein Fis
MPKKKKDQTEGPEAPVNQTFSEPAAAADQTSANQAISQNAAPAAATTSQEVAQPQSQIPPDLVELIQSTLTVVVAQRKTHGIAVTLTSLVNMVKKTLERYLKRVPTYTIREFVKSQLLAMGYPIIDALVEYKGDVYNAEVVILYRNFEEVVDMVKKGRMNTIMKSLVSNEVNPLYDKKVP